MKILMLDIETSPCLADVWSLWKTNVSLSQLRKSAEVLCWGAQWHGDRKMHYGTQWGDGPLGQIEKMHSLLDEADAVVHYNGNRFDIPHLNREMIQHGLTPPRPYKNIDLFQVVRRTFRFPSNKLGYVAPAIGLDSKLAHEGHALWVKVMAGDPVAQRKMLRYCGQDVRLLGPLYTKLKPWINGHPNHNLYRALGAPEGCTKCGSTDLKRDGRTVLTSGTYQQFRCTSCGGWSRGSKRLDGVTIQGARL